MSVLGFNRGHVTNEHGGNRHEQVRNNQSGVCDPAGEMYRGKQGLDYVPAVSAENVDSTGIWFGMITIPPGGRTVAHLHEGHETALFVMSGDEVEV